ncbi:MAG TPA: ferredoxin [Acidimicrobiales bacterium]|nr:ferredoxin [Acidimicrobiales bacterium]
MSARVRIDPTRCRGHAICALFYPEGIELDRWGYGRVVDPTPGESRNLKRVLRAVAACPNDAVVLVVDEGHDAAAAPSGP